MVLRGSFGVKDRKITITCAECRKGIDVLVIVLERLEEIICPHCGGSFRVEP